MAKSVQEKDKRVTKIEFRTSPRLKSKVKALARIYADGNLSAWLEHAALNAPRVRLKK